MESDLSGVLWDATEYVKKELEGNDASHDWYHIKRVMDLAIKIAEREKMGTDSNNHIDMDVVKMGALMHDIKDWKYSGSDTAGAEAVEKWLTEKRYPVDKIQKVLEIVKGISFSSEIGETQKDMSIELKIVQDADRLDAMGAIGIARAFTFGGARRNPIHKPDVLPREITKETYKKEKNGTTINHFYEKLLKLKDMMKTKTGRRVASQRHQYMESFVYEFLHEWLSEDV